MSINVVARDESVFWGRMKAAFLRSKIWKIKVLFGRLVTADDKECKIKRSNNIKQHERQAFQWIAEFVSVEMIKVKKNMLKQVKF